MELICDILSDINKDFEQLKKHWNNNYLRNTFEYAFFPEKKMLLPEGIPPYKQPNGVSAEMRGGYWMEAKKFHVYLRQDLKPMNRERMFITCLENISAEEAKVLLAVKDQTLSELYPNITREKLEEVGYFKKTS